MDFRITADEEHVIFLIVGRLEAGSTPTVDDLTDEAGHDVAREVDSLRRKGWILVRDDVERRAIAGLSPMAMTALRNIRTAVGRHGKAPPMRHGNARTGPLSTC